MGGVVDPSLLFAALPFPAFAVGGDAVVLAWNPAAERAYGWSAAEAVGAPAACLGARREAVLGLVERVLAGGVAEELEIALTLRSGAVRPTRLRAAPFGPPAGGVLFAEAGEPARNAGAGGGDGRASRLQAVLDAIPAPIFFKDVGGAYLGCNAAFERYVGLSRAAIVGKTVFDVAPPDLAPVYRAADDVLFSSGGPQVYEAHVQWADGTRRDVVFHKAAIRDEAGRVSGLAGAMLDVTDLRSTERALRDRLVQQAALTTIATHVLHEEDPRRLGEAALLLTVGAQAAAVGSVLEIAQEGGATVVRCAAGAGPAAAVPVEQDPLARRLVATGGPLVSADGASLGVPVPEPLGPAPTFSVAAVLIGAREAPRGILAVYDHAARRFTEDDVQALETVAHVLAVGLGRRHALDAAREAQERLARAQRLAAIGTLAAGVAHELNNPLTFVLSNVELVANGLRRLRGAPPDADGWDEALHALDDALEGAERMRVIVRDLRTMARADASGSAPVDVRKVLEYAAHLAWNDVRPRARLTWDVGDVPPVRGSEGRLGQVFVNLIVNAAHAIPEGNPAAHAIRLSARREGDGRVAISVSDTGAGIPPEHLPRIFDPFFTTKPAGLGTGLGLWVCHNIVTAFGGTLDVASEVGRGTTFRVVLSAADPADPSRARRAPDGARDGRVRRRVLVVDDEPLVAATVRRQLASDYVVEAASGARDALARIAKDRYDAVVCDVVMEGLDGLEFLEALRRETPALADRVLFVTGGLSPRATEHLAESGVPWIAKPFDGRQLRQALRELLAGSHAAHPTP